MPTAQRTIVPTIVLAIVVLTILATAGLFMRGYLGNAFAATEQVRDARDLGFAAIKLQLDEETGIRGFAATGDRVFLQPYYEARTALTSTFDKLQHALAERQISDGLAFLADARATSELWNATTAARVIASPHGQIYRQLRGKHLMDQYRRAMTSLDAILAVHEETVVQRTGRAIDEMNLFVGAIVALLLIGAVAYGIGQIRVASRLEGEQQRLADARRERAELQAAYLAEKRIADTLQEAFSQRPLPSLPALHFSATYVPATEETRVGGDWYDALELPGNRVLFAIGDVTGHGIEAAVSMNRSRQALISSALLDDDPAAVLANVNAEIAAYAGPLVTAVAGYANAETFEFVYAIAGHPPPVLIEPGTEPRFLECGSLPLGAMKGATYRTYRVQSVPGATLVLYTDGAVEHSRDVLAGEQQLLRAVADASEAGAADFAASIHRSIFDHRSVGDDVAILTISFAVRPAVGMTISADNAQTGFTSRLRRIREASPAPMPIATARVAPDRMAS